MLERQLSRLLSHGLRRGISERSWQWLVIAVATYVIRRLLRDEAHVERFTVKPGHRVEVVVRERDA